MKKTKSEIDYDTAFVPNKWPGAFGLYNYSKTVVSFNLQPFLLALIGAYLADIFSSYAHSLILRILLLIVFYLFMLSSLVVLVGSIKRDKLTFSEAVDKAARISLRVLAIYILLTLAAAISFVLLVIPFFFVVPRLILAPYYLIDRNTGIFESIQLAWKNGEGHALKTWGVIGVQILFALLSLILIGIYFSIIYSAAFIILYAYTSNVDTKTINKKSRPVAKPRKLQKV
ncbi:MAG TPA: hypothetical protein VFN31_01695 [Candidatus Saccharimonadales bacterium]|nr:hypothetical protein [Candidatus Saccharimonadales bacterium]